MLTDFLSFIEESIYSGCIIFSTFLFGNLYLKRRSNYYLRSLTTTIPLTLLGGSYYFILMNYLKSLDIDFVYLFNAFWYPGLLVLFYLAFIFSFKTSFLKSLLPFTMGFLLETSIFGFFRLFIDLKVIGLREISVFSVLFELIFRFLLVFIVIYIITYFTKKKKLNYDPNSSWYLFIGLIVLIMFLRLNLQGVYEVAFNSTREWIINISLALIPLVFLILILAILTNLELNKDKSLLENLLLEKEKQYQISKENIDIINRKCHDIKYQIRSLEFLDSENKKEALDEMSKSISIYDTSINTGNNALNAILSEKSLYCVSHNIKFSKIIDGNKLSFMKLSDVFALFGNILDNAIEAVEKIKDGNKRVISLTSSFQNNYLTIRVDNYFINEVKINNDSIETTKSDKAYHGFGTKSIKYIVEKYNGNLIIKTEGDIFILVMSFKLA